ncbi:NAD(P)-dependent oxidoreductase [Nocardia mexicana]|uniref:Putative NADH-flavin reductase n=1 Tax=Nocardia mexicana TaxID=279262 RepID=A0A370GT24_9NOCA|nr:NAD(P)H-binding protein [Nocardia mexicana]RDI46852.1 putative NADH-flavin reductase [Nocardia mexicana]
MSAIAVVGATGRTGRLVVAQALARGHRVTAIVRRAGSLTPAPGLTIVAADPTAPGALAGTLDQQDAVISALGATGRGPTTLYSTAATELIAALRPGARLLVISSAGLDVPDDAGRTTRLFAHILHRIMRHIYTDMKRMESQLTQSNLRWTSVRPTRLTDTPPTGSPQISLGANEKVAARTSRADLAAYLLDAVTDPHTEHTVVALSS